ncbi:nucleotidyltransferase domain-containing protein [Spirillospora sp. NPDC047279]|uniref:nucleotidyltransferase domain-containing protein n=1 Tax=Spirillospora sp. NPDC047279 TaxID=3155478 RepID=UPI0033FAC457
MKALVCTDGIRAALKPVGLGPEEVIEVLGSCLEGDEVHLVGSLAAGLGNTGSDVDLHVFVDEDVAGVVPMLFFAGRTRLDVVHYRTGAPAAALAGVPVRSTGLFGGRCALGAVPSMTDMKRLSRWATALAMYEGTRPILDEDETARVSAALVRLALDVAVRAAALATVMTARNAPLAGLAWSRAAETAVEVLVRAQGEIFVGDKWLAAKARRGGLSPEVLAEARRVGSAAEHARFTARLGLPIAEPATLVRVRRNEAPEFTFGDSTFQLAGDHLIPRFELPSESLGEALGTLGADALSEALVHHAAELVPDPAAVDGRLS